MSLKMLYSSGAKCVVQKVHFRSWACDCLGPVRRAIQSHLLHRLLHLISSGNSLYLKVSIETPFHGILCPIRTFSNHLLSFFRCALSPNCTVCPPLKSPISNAHLFSIFSLLTGSIPSCFLISAFSFRFQSLIALSIRFWISPIP